MKYSHRWELNWELTRWHGKWDFFYHRQSAQRWVLDGNKPRAINYQENRIIYLMREFVTCNIIFWEFFDRTKWPEERGTQVAWSQMRGRSNTTSAHNCDKLIYYQTYNLFLICSWWWRSMVCSLVVFNDFSFRGGFFFVFDCYLKSTRDIREYFHPSHKKRKNLSVESDNEKYHFKSLIRWWTMKN